MIATFKYDNAGIMYFFVAKSFEGRVVKGKYLTPNEAKEAYEFSEEVEEEIDFFENGFTLVYEGETTSRLVPFTEAKNLLRTNPQMPRILQ